MTVLTESNTQRAVLDLLAAKRIRHWRMNSGAMLAEHNGKKRFLRFGEPGMADIMAVTSFRVRHMVNESTYWADIPRIVWLEIKSPTGKQSAAQKEFQRNAEANGETYLLVRDINQVVELFG